MRKKKWLLSLFLCFVAMCVFTSCAKRTDVREGDEFIYCINSDQTGLIKVSFDIPDGETQEVAAAVIEELSRPAEGIGYLPAIPENVTVQECRVDHAIAYVDFSSGYLDLLVLQEKLVRAAVVQSLLQIENISGVWLSVDGENLKDSTGKSIGLLNSDDFVQNTGSSLSSYQTDTFTLYFANETGDKLVEQQMDVTYSSNVSREKVIVEKLMGGPKSSGAYPTINPAATLLSVTIQDGICYVNFDSEFLNSVYDVMPEVTIYSLVNSLVQGTNVDRVQITVNGEKNVSYRETVDLSQPIGQQTGWVEGMEELEEADGIENIDETEEIEKKDGTENVEKTGNPGESGSSGDTE